MDDATQKLITLLVLQRLPGTAANTLQKLLDHFRSLETLVQAGPAELGLFLGEQALQTFGEFQKRGILSAPGEKAARDLEYVNKQGLLLLTQESIYYPPLLKEIHSIPPLLMLQGNPQALLQEQIAIVGSRKASPTGLDIAQQFAHELAASGYTIISGMALGIDAFAHTGALSVDPDLNRYATVAVVATGLDLCYPRAHEKLRKQIGERGAIISEFPLGTPPQKENFPRRNRIISGLAKGVLVVEAEQRSGSLITARYALEQNRDVFAVPGSIRNPASRGCHQLIRDGAYLVESADDILSELNHPFGRIDFRSTPLEKKLEEDTAAGAENSDKLTDSEKMLVRVMDENPVTIDQLVRRTLLKPEVILAVLTSLEIRNLVRSSEGGYRIT